jgi:hypothetical protein
VFLDIVYDVDLFPPMVGEHTSLLVVSDAPKNLKRSYITFGVESNSTAAFDAADPTGFEPAFSSLTGKRVRPGYTTDPFYLYKLA